MRTRWRCRPLRVLHADGARALEEDPRDAGARLHLEVGPRHHRVQVRAGGGEASAVADVAVERGEALLAVSVHVVGERVAGLLHGLEERPEQRAGCGPAFESERARVAAERVVDVGREARSPSA